MDFLKFEIANRSHKNGLDVSFQWCNWKALQLLRANDKNISSRNSQAECIGYTGSFHRELGILGFEYYKLTSKPASTMSTMYYVITQWMLKNGQAQCHHWWRPRERLDDVLCSLSRQEPAAQGQAPENVRI